MSSYDRNLASKTSHIQEQVDGFAVDRISDLPDQLLLHILSYMSAVYVVRTSVLARRWKCVWASVPCLNFDQACGSNTFVNKFLLNYQASAICKLRVDRVLSESDCSELWIRWAIDRKVRELDIGFGPNYTPLHYLPETIFDCTTLEVLSLNSGADCQVYTFVPPSACFPCLKTLELHSVNCPVDVQFENKLIACCVVLEHLSIIKSSVDSKRNIYVHGTQLKSLNLLIRRSFGDNACVMEINAPSLQDLFIDDDGAYSKVLLANVGNLCGSVIKLGNGQAFQSLLDCFSALQNVKRLYLSAHYTTQLHLLLRPNAVVHNVNLTHLVVGASSVWVQLLPYFFHCFPNLAVLKLKKDSPVNRLIMNLSTKPELIPTGLLSNLRVFVAEEPSTTTAAAYGMLEYILNNGKVLERVDIRYQCSSRPLRKCTSRKGTKARQFEEGLIACQEELRKSGLLFLVASKILGLPRASPKCKIRFDVVKE